MQQDFELLQQPAYVLSLNIPFDKVDVNVHPTKHEVRFYQPRLIHDFIVSSLVSVLSQDIELAPNKDSENLATTNLQAASQQQYQQSPSAEKKQHLSPSISRHESVKPSHEYRARTDLAVDRLDFTAINEYRVMEKVESSINNVVFDGGKLCLFEKNDMVFSFAIQPVMITLNQLDLCAKLDERNKEFGKYLLIPERIQLSERMATFWQQMQTKMHDLECVYEFITQQDLLLRKIPRTLFPIQWQNLFTTTSFDVNDISNQDDGYELVKRISAKTDCPQITQETISIILDHYFHFCEHDKLEKLVKKHSYQDFYF